MWDKQWQARKESRKRAARAAQARTARRGVARTNDSAAEPDPVEVPPEPAEPELEIGPEMQPDSEPEPTRHDPAGSLAWTGLVLLTLILGGFMAAMLFMLG